MRTVELIIDHLDFILLACKTEVSTPQNDISSLWARDLSSLKADCNGSRVSTVFCSPSGTLRISIQATWLKHSSPDNDTMTEISGMSIGKSMQSSLEDQVSPCPLQSELIYCAELADGSCAVTCRHTFSCSKINCQLQDLSGFEPKDARSQKSTYNPSTQQSQKARPINLSPPPSPDSGPLKKGLSLAESKGGKGWTNRRRQGNLREADIDEEQVGCIVKFT